MVIFSELSYRLFFIYKSSIDFKSMKGENIFLVGDKLTLADLALATFLSIGTVVGKYPLGWFQTH